VSGGLHIAPLAIEAAADEVTSGVTVAALLSDVGADDIDPDILLDAELVEAAVDVAASALMVTPAIDDTVPLVARQTGLYPSPRTWPNPVLAFPGGWGGDAVADTVEQTLSLVPDVVDQVAEPAPPAPPPLPFVPFWGGYAAPPLPREPKRLPPKIRVSDVVEEVTSLLRVLASCDDAIDRRAIQELEDQAVLAFWLAEPVR
jgi:hypothetical protein